MSKITLYGKVYSRRTLTKEVVVRLDAPREEVELCGPNTIETRSIGDMLRRAGYDVTERLGGEGPIKATWKGQTFEMGQIRPVFGLKPRLQQLQ